MEVINPAEMNPAWIPRAAVARISREIHSSSRGGPLKATQSTIFEEKRLLCKRETDRRMEAIRARAPTTTTFHSCENQKRDCHQSSACRISSTECLSSRFLSRSLRSCLPDFTEISHSGHCNCVPRVDTFLDRHVRGEASFSRAETPRVSFNRTRRACVLIAVGSVVMRKSGSNERHSTGGYSVSSCHSRDLFPGITNVTDRGRTTVARAQPDDRQAISL